MKWNFFQLHKVRVQQHKVGLVDNQTGGEVVVGRVVEEAKTDREPE